MPPSRRQFLHASVAVGVALAGCSNRDGDTGSSPAPSPPGTSPPGTTGTTDATGPPPTPTGPARETARQVGDPPLAVVGDTAAFVATDDSLRAHALDDGAPVWDRSPGRITGLVSAGGTLFSLTAPGVVQSRDDDGSRDWTGGLDAPGQSLAVAAGTVVALGADGTTAAFAASDGTERWRTRVEGTAVGLAADADRVYVATDAPTRLHAIDPGSGDQRWQATPGLTVTAPPTAVADGVLVGATFPGHRPGDPTPSPTPEDSAAPGAVLAYGPAGQQRWLTRVEGSPSWIRSVGGGFLVGFDGFLFEALTEVPQVAGLAPDGQQRWRRQYVPFRQPAAVTRGVALQVDPEAPVRTPAEEGVPRGQTALRTGSGDTVWTSEIGAATAAAAGRSFVTVEGSTVRARDALAGTERWSTGR